MKLQEKFSKQPKLSKYCEFTVDDIVKLCMSPIATGLDRLECRKHGLLRPEVIDELLNNDLYVNTWNHDNIYGIGGFIITWDSENIELIPELRKGYEENGYLKKK